MIDNSKSPAIWLLYLILIAIVTATGWYVGEIFNKKEMGAFFGLAISLFIVLTLHIYLYDDWYRSMYYKDIGTQYSNISPTSSRCSVGSTSSSSRCSQEMSPISSKCPPSRCPPLQSQTTMTTFPKYSRKLIKSCPMPETYPRQREISCRPCHLSSKLLSTRISDVPLPSSFSSPEILL